MPMWPSVYDLDNKDHLARVSFNPKSWKQTPKDEFFYSIITTQFQVLNYIILKRNFNFMNLYTINKNLDKNSKPFYFTLKVV